MPDPESEKPSSVTEVGSHWFEAMADFMGPSYLRYSFTKGTSQEVAFLMDAVGIHAAILW